MKVTTWKQKYGITNSADNSFYNYHLWIAVVDSVCNTCCHCNVCISVCCSYTIDVPQKHVLGTKQDQTNHLGLILGVPGSQWHCTFFCFR